MYQACRWIVPLDVTCCKPPVWCGPSTGRGQGVAYSAENPPRHLGTLYISEWLCLQGGRSRSMCPLSGHVVGVSFVT